MGNCLVTNEKSLSERTDLVRRMAVALDEALAATAADPDKAFEISRKYVENLEADDPIQKQVLLESIKLWRFEPEPAQSAVERWENMQGILLDLGLMAVRIDVREAFSDAFVE